MSQRQARRFVLHLVIPSKTGDCIAAEVLEDGVLRLPNMGLLEGLELTEERVSDIEIYIEKQLGIRVYIVRKLREDSKTRERVPTAYHRLLLVGVFDNNGALRKPFTWICQDVACRSTWMQMNVEVGGDDVKRQVNFALQEAHNEVSEERHEAWDTLGWMPKATSWVHEILDQRNLVMDGRMRQRHECGDSIVLSCEVKMWVGGEQEHKERFETLFIKASIPEIREGLRTAAIRNVIGSIVPEIIGVHERYGLMIQRNGGTLTDEPWDQEALISTILKMQTLSIDRIKELEAGGLEVRDSEWVELNVKSILNHEVVDMCYEDCGDGRIDETMKVFIEKLRARVDLIVEESRSITRLGLPRTIVHGDLGLQNVGSRLKREGNVYQIFDWATSFIGNPLHDFAELQRCADELPEYPINVMACAKQLVEHWQHYELWSDYYEGEDVDALFNSLRVMNNVIWVHYFIQQHDANDKFKSRRESIRRDILVLLQDLEVMLPEVENAPDVVLNEKDSAPASG